MPLSAHQLLDDLRAVAAAAPGPSRARPLEVRRLDVQAAPACPGGSSPAAERAAVVALLKTHTDGWICTGSGVYTVIHGQITAVSGPEAPELGEVLSAELVQDGADRAGASVHLRRHGAELWVHHLTEREDAGEELIAEELRFASTGPPGADRPLRYRVYWGPDARTAADAPAGSVRRVARFCGFEE
jgi:hypothetical protein